MKIKILPEFHLNQTEDDLNQEYTPFYTGDKPWEKRIVDNTLYVAVFFIPFLLFIIMMQYFGFAPFGSHSMFVIDGSINNIPVLTEFITQLRTGQLHLFSIKGGLNGEFYSTFAYYLSSPFTLITLFFDQATAVGLLSIFTALRISMSAPIMLYYLTHREYGRRGSKFDTTLLFFSLGYALSSYALVQYNDFMFLDIFMLFPLLFLGFEHVLKNQSLKLYYVTLALCLFSNFFLGLTIIMVLAILFFVYGEETTTDRILRFPRFIGANLAAMLTSAITVIPGLAGFYQHIIKTTEIEIPHSISDFFNLYLKHFFYDSPSYEKTAYFGSNLYVGTFLLILISLYFLNNHLSAKTRIKNLLMLAFLAVSVSFSSLLYFFHLGSGQQSSFSNFAFLYLFIFISLSFDVFREIRNIPLWRVLVSFFIPIVLGLVAMNRANPLPNFQSVNFTLDLLVVFAILLTLYRLGSIKRKIFYLLITSVAVLELLANSFQYEACISAEDISLYSVLTPENNPYAGSITDGRANVYNNYYSIDENTNYLYSSAPSNMLTGIDNVCRYDAFSDAFDSLKYLYVSKELESTSFDPTQYVKIADTEQYVIYENLYAFPTAYFTPADLTSPVTNADFVSHRNAIARLLGAPADIYKEADADINVELSHPETAKLDVMGQGLYGFSKHYSKEFDESDTSRNYRITTHIDSHESGSLYTYQNTFAYYDQVEDGKSYETYLYDPLDNSYDKIMLIKAYLLNADALNQLKSTLESNACQLQYKNKTTVVTQVNADKDGHVFTILPYSKYYRVLVDGHAVRPGSFEGRLQIPVSAGNHEITIQYRFTPFYYGIALSIISLLLAGLLLFAKRREPAAKKQTLKQIATRITTAVIDFCYDNRIYILSFLIPFGTYLVTMIITGCTPFGKGNLFTDDGIQIALPATHDGIMNFKEGIGAHTWIAGGGRYAWKETVRFYQLLSYEGINTFIPLYTVFKLALAGTALVFYLTHRLKGVKADKHDIRLLVAAISYSMCNYMLMMLNNFRWYNGLLAFPLVLLGMDYLMIKKKKRYYILMLAISITTQYYISMFICFFLVAWFFTYHFDSIKDFILKGIRFAICSLFMLGLCYPTIFGTVSMISSGTYGQEYAGDTFSLPAHYFFSAWNYLLKQQMAFPETFTISWNEGDVNLYFGVLPLFLIIFYLLSRKVSIADKLRFLIPYGIFFVSLNESVMNFVLNGMHYQHGVPNRFSFLLALMAATISYDSLLLLENSSVLSLIPAGLIVAAGFTYAFITSEKDVILITSFAVSVILLIAYLIICLLIRYAARYRKQMIGAITLLFILEICANAYTTISGSMLETRSMDYSSPAAKYLKANTDLDNTLDRVIVRSPLCHDYAMVDRVKSIQIFDAGAISNAQQKFGSYTGNSTGDNIITTICSSTLMGDSIGGNRYIIINDAGQSELAGDLDNYKLIARTEHNYILENEYCFPFGYYLPESILEDQQDSKSVNDVWQTLSYAMVDTDDFLVSPYPLYNNDTLGDDEKKDIDYFTGYKSPDGKYMLKIHLQAPETGELYTQFADFQYLCYHEEGDIVDFEFDATDYHTGDFPNVMTMCVFNKEVFYQLYDAISAHPFTVDSFTSDTVDGHITMPEDGIINFTMPYNGAWQAYVDGEKVPSYAHANAFYAIKAPKGEHEIQLRFITYPNLKSYRIHRGSWGVFLLLMLLSSYLSWKKKNKQIPAISETGESE